MRILANKKNKQLFLGVVTVSLVFTLIALIFIGLKIQNAQWAVWVCMVCMSLSILTMGYGYFSVQSRIMEEAVTQIKAYVAGDRNARIECDDEGELYRLFHEVNALVSILNAHAENEAKAKVFLKNTISDISHQLKTPLAALNIYNGLMQEEVKDLPELKSFVLLSEQEIDRIEVLVQNLLKITKFDSGTIVMEKAAVNVSEMMDSIERHFSFRAGQEEKTLYLSGDDAVTLWCDRNWVIEAIRNLVKNAFDHTQAGDAIRVEWRQFASVVQIVVKDTGSGIHTEDLNHIFKRFYRSRFSKDTQGLGLGLPLVKAIVEAHSGTIEVTSTLGSGTVFSINFLIPTKL